MVLPEVARRLEQDSYRGDVTGTFGEDSAVVETSCDELLLITVDSIAEDLCANYPYSAGFNVVLANVMDIYAAGGVPTSISVVVSYIDDSMREGLLSGITRASQVFRVPIVRGHTNPGSARPYVVGCATGRVDRRCRLTSCGARSGDTLLLLHDRVGARGKNYKLGWDSVTGRSPDEIRVRLAVMNSIAERHLVNASKDVSVAGLIGTAAMMVEHSGRGAVIHLDQVEKICPPEVGIEDWLRMYISLGFLLSVDEDHVKDVIKIAADHLMSASPIGVVDGSREFRLRLGREERMLFDFSHGPILIPPAQQQGAWPS